MSSTAATALVPAPTNGSSTKSHGDEVRAMQRPARASGNSAPWPFLPLEVGRHQTSVARWADSKLVLGPPSRASRSFQAALSKYGVRSTDRWRTYSACRDTRLLTGSGVEVCLRQVIK